MRAYVRVPGGRTYPTAYATCTARPKGDRLGRGVPARLGRGLLLCPQLCSSPGAEGRLLSPCKATPAAEGGAGRSAPRACGRGP